MNYQEFIKNIYTSLKSINLKQQKLEEHFQSTFQKIENLDAKIDSVSNKIDDFIDISNRINEKKQITLSNSLNNISENLTSIQTEQYDIITTMSDVRNIEDNMSVLLDDYLSSELIINNELHIDLSLDNTSNKNNTLLEEKDIVDINDLVCVNDDVINKIDNNSMIYDKELIIGNEIIDVKEDYNTNENYKPIIESEDELLILE